MSLQKYQKYQKHQSLLADISQKLNSYYDTEKNIYETIKLIGEHINVSRVYIFEDDEFETTSNTYEWCNENISHQKENLQKIDLKVISVWYETLKNDGRIFSTNIKELPLEIREILESQEIKSILIFPLEEKDDLFGFVGFDECSSNRIWDKEEIELLRTISNILSSTFNRIKIENELRNSINFSENLLNTANVMIVGLDKNGYVNIFNNAAEKLTSYSKNEIIGKNWFTEINILPKDELEKVKNVFSVLLTDAKSSNEFENSIITKYGEIKYILWQNNEVIENNEVIGIISFGLDITERKIHEYELLKQKERAEKSEQMKIAFLANMSQDLRTPINSIIGFSELLKDNGVTKEQRLEYLDIIMKNGDILTNLINDIIDISKIDSEMLKVQKVEIDLNKFFQDLKIQYSKQMKKTTSKIKLNIDIDINSNVFILADKYRLKQIMMNLIGNAIKFTKKGYIKFGYKILCDNKLQIYVKDTGCGISEENIPRLFDRFIQINQPGISKSNKGYGLGLAISKSLVNLMGFGDIKLESEVGIGSRFYFETSFIFKDDTEIQIFEESEDEQKFDFTDLKILIVEDNIEINRILKLHMMSVNAKVFTSYGIGVMDIIKSKKIDLVLLDLGLAEISGYDLLKDIKDYNKDIKVIIQSAYTVSEYRNKAFEMGADDFIFKPFNKNQLLKMIKKQI